MTFNDMKGNYEWKEQPEREDGYYFILKDTLHHQDYNVILVKDTGKITVNGDYINDVPHELAMAIAPRLDYFMAQKGCCDNHRKHCAEKKAEHKKEEKKSEPKKSEKKEK